MSLFRGGIFWFGMLFIPLFVLMPDVIYKSLQRSMYKTNAQEIQENELTNRDVETVIRRSKITETARLLKSAFSFTRTHPPPTTQQQTYRGFAFSQEENGVVRQSDLIRVYYSEFEKPAGN
jgi:phospholipid-transporting ATPase